MKPVSHLRYFLLLLFLTLGLVGGATLRAEGNETTKPEAPAPAAVEPAKDAEEAEPAVKSDETVEEEKQAAEAEDDAAAEKTSEKSESKKRRSHVSHHSDRERVNVGGDTHLKAGESAEVVVSIMGSSHSAGDVSDAVVSVLGSTRVTGGTVGN